MFGYGDRLEENLKIFSELNKFGKFETKSMEDNLVQTETIMAKVWKVQEITEQTVISCPNIICIFSKMEQRGHIKLMGTGYTQ